ncbi:MAG: hypothetical protein ABJG47_15230 [Ekhidna sp.]
MKKKIVIASLLKPVDDVRAYWKLSQSMAKTNKYEVNIIGNSGKKEKDEKNIKFLHHKLDRKNWLKRLVIRELIFFRILRIRPSLLIITTHELLNNALLIKLITGCKVVYDVQENHGLNLSSINPTLLKKILSKFIRLKETFSRRFVDQFWLAESCYAEELSFVQDKFLILENKALDLPYPRRDFSSISMLFSGTISDYGGVRRAVGLFYKIQSDSPKTTLKIIGQVHDSSLKNWLESEQKNNPGLMLNISTTPVPYDQILEAIFEANLGIIGYEPSEVNREKIPTKLYEYSRYRLPFLVKKNTKWSKVGLRLGAAIPVAFDEENHSKISETFKNVDSFLTKTYPEDATWENESVKAVNSIETLIN